MTVSLMGTVLLEPVAAPAAKILRLGYFLTLDFLYLCTFKRWVLTGSTEAATFLLWGILDLLTILILAVRGTLLVSRCFSLILVFGLVNGPRLTGEGRNIWGTRI